ncbi:hypothetical protein [Brevundimonas sp.]|uniref:hypothetical protein n=1 Tax=Brevundimonas sp. TaxID=1871086 RepID=UPI0028997F2A|nr:hypothetical protein [Brevundimonas sp.]
MTEGDHLAGSRASILAHVEELKADRDRARAALHAMISGDVKVPMNAPADAVSAVATYEQRIASLDKAIASYEADLAAGRYVD